MPENPKRLRETYSWSRWPPESKWLPAKTKWQELGVDADTIVVLLRKASLHRIMFEGMVGFMAELRVHQATFKRRAAAIESMLRDGQPFLDLMKRRSDLFGASYEQVQAGIDRLFAELADENPGSATSRLWGHRPGDPWLTGFVVELARHFLTAKQTLPVTRRLILDAFVLAGHQDRVTESKIRHILNQAIKRTNVSRPKQ